MTKKTDKSNKTNSRPTKRKKIEFEALEPRILLSADIAMGGLPQVDDVTLGGEIAPIVLVLDDTDLTKTATQSDRKPKIEGLDVGVERLVQTDEQTEATNTAESASTEITEEAVGAMIPPIVFLSGAPSTALNHSTVTTNTAITEVIVIDQGVDEPRQLITSLLKDVEGSSLSPNKSSGPSDANETAGDIIAGISIAEIELALLEPKGQSVLIQGEQGVALLVIGQNADGISDISKMLGQLEGLAAVHLLSHGSNANIRLGNTNLSQRELNQRRVELAAWGDALAPGADFLIYGCDVAGSAEGKDFLQSFSRLVGVDVSASDDTTGATAQTGDWDLEHQVGVVETRSLAAGDWQGLLFEPSRSYQVKNGFEGAGDEALEGFDTLDFTEVTGVLEITVMTGGFIEAKVGGKTLNASGVKNIVGGSGDTRIVFQAGVKLTGSLRGAAVGTATTTLVLPGGTLNQTGPDSGEGSFLDGTYTNIQNIEIDGQKVTYIGQDLEDTITGGESDDNLYGAGGPDTLEGGEGADTLNGGPGSDQLTGGEGADTLIFSNSQDLVDDEANETSPESTGNDADVDTLDGGPDNDTYLIKNDATGTANIVERDGEGDYDKLDLSELLGNVKVAFSADGSISVLREEGLLPSISGEGQSYTKGLVFLPLSSSALNIKVPTADNYKEEGANFSFDFYLSIEGAAPQKISVGNIDLSRVDLTPHISEVLVEWDSDGKLVFGIDGDKTLSVWTEGFFGRENLQSDVSKVELPVTKKEGKYPKVKFKLEHGGQIYSVDIPENLDEAAWLKAISEAVNAPGAAGVALNNLVSLSDDDRIQAIWLQKVAEGISTVLEGAVEGANVTANIIDDQLVINFGVDRGFLAAHDNFTLDDIDSDLLGIKVKLDAASGKNLEQVISGSHTVTYQFEKGYLGATNLESSPSLTAPAGKILDLSLMDINLIVEVSASSDNLLGNKVTITSKDTTLKIVAYDVAAIKTGLGKDSVIFKEGAVITGTLELGGDDNTVTLSGAGGYLSDDAGTPLSVFGELKGQYTLDITNSDASATGLNIYFRSENQIQKISGSEGSDLLHGRADDETLEGLGGNDFLYGDKGVDKLFGDDGNDRLDGGAGNDTLYGGAGSDVLTGGENKDTMYGGSGNDAFIFGGSWGQDTILKSDAQKTQREDTLDFTNVASAMVFRFSEGSLKAGDGTFAYEKDSDGKDTNNPQNWGKTNYADGKIKGDFGEGSNTVSVDKKALSLVQEIKLGAGQQTLLLGKWADESSFDKQIPGWFKGIFGDGSQDADITIDTSLVTRSGEPLVIDFRDAAATLTFEFYREKKDSDDISLKVSKKNGTYPLIFTKVDQNTTIYTGGSINVLKLLGDATFAGNIIGSSGIRPPTELALDVVDAGAIIESLTSPFINSDDQPNLLEIFKAPSSGQIVNIVDFTQSSFLSVKTANLNGPLDPLNDPLNLFSGRPKFVQNADQPLNELVITVEGAKAFYFQLGDQYSPSLVEFKLDNASAIKELIETFLARDFGNAKVIVTAAGDEKVTYTITISDDSSGANLRNVPKLKIANPQSIKGFSGIITNVGDVNYGGGVNLLLGNGPTANNLTGGNVFTVGGNAIVNKLTDGQPLTNKQERNAKFAGLVAGETFAPGLHVMSGFAGGDTYRFEGIWALALVGEIPDVNIAGATIEGYDTLDFSGVAVDLDFTIVEITAANIIENQAIFVGLQAAHVSDEEPEAPPFDVGSNVIFVQGRGVEGLIGGLLPDSIPNAMFVLANDIENIIGGSGTNTFHFVGTPELQGTIQAAGEVVLDYSEYDSSVNVDLGEHDIQIIPPLDLGILGEFPGAFLTFGSASAVTGNRFLGFEDVIRALGAESVFTEEFAVSEVNNVIAGESDDVLKGNSFANTFVLGQGGEDDVDGRGSDDDRVSFYSASNGVLVNLEGAEDSSASTGYAWDSYLGTMTNITDKTQYFRPGSALDIYRLTFRGEFVDLARESTAAELESALEGLQDIVDVVVTGDHTDGFLIEFVDYADIETGPTLGLASITKFFVKIEDAGTETFYSLTVGGGHFVITLDGNPITSGSMVDLKTELDALGTITEFTHAKDQQLLDTPEETETLTTLKRVEHVSGSSGDDVIIGNEAQNRVFVGVQQLGTSSNPFESSGSGAWGNDVFIGSGNDIIDLTELTSGILEENPYETETLFDGVFLVTTVDGSSLLATGIETVQKHPDLRFSNLISTGTRELISKKSSLEATAEGSLTDVLVDSAAVADVWQAAKQLWIDAGADAAFINSLNYRIDALSGATLAKTEVDGIVIDDSGAGHGWFVDGKLSREVVKLLFPEGDELISLSIPELSTSYSFTGMATNEALAAGLNGVAEIAAAGGVTVTSDSTGWLIKFRSTDNRQPILQLDGDGIFSKELETLQDGAQPSQVIPAVDYVSPLLTSESIQVVLNPEAVSSALSFYVVEGWSTKDDYFFDENATAASIEADLNLLPNIIAVGGVTVRSGDVDNSWILDFVSMDNIPQLSLRETRPNIYETSRTKTYEEAFYAGFDDFLNRVAENVLGRVNPTKFPSVVSVEPTSDGSSYIEFSLQDINGEEVSKVYYDLATTRLTEVLTEGGEATVPTLTSEAIKFVRNPDANISQILFSTNNGWGETKAYTVAKNATAASIEAGLNELALVANVGGVTVTDGPEANTWIIEFGSEADLPIIEQLEQVRPEFSTRGNVVNTLANVVDPAFQQLIAGGVLSRVNNNWADEFPGVVSIETSTDAATFMEFTLRDADNNEVGKVYYGLFLIDVVEVVQEAGDIIAPSSQIDLLTVMAHEIGHQLGLDHTSSGLMASLLENGTRTSVDQVQVSLTGPASVVEGETTTDYTVTLDHTVPAGNSVTVNLAYSGTAQDGIDFTGVGSVVVTGGNTSATFNLATLDDALADNAESIVIEIASIVDTNNSFDVIVEGPNHQVTTTINDATGSDSTPGSDDQVEVSLTGPTAVVEGEVTTDYTVSLDQAVPAGNSVTVNLAYSGTAIDGTDFTGVTSVVVAAGNASSTFTLSTLDNALLDSARNIVVEIASINDTNSSFEAMVKGANNQVTTSIADDVDAVLIDLSGPTSLIEAGAAGTYTVSLKDAFGDTISAVTDVTIALSYSGTAADGADFNGLTTVTVVGGSNTGTFDISALAEGISEGVESFTVSLGAITGGSEFESLLVDAANDEVTTTIADIDSSVLTVDDITVNEADGTATFTVALSQAVVSGFTVDYTLTDGTATSGVDYTGTGGTITFAGTAGEIQTIVVPVSDDFIADNGETFTVSLSASTALVDDGDTATATINDDVDNVEVNLTGPTSVVEGETTTDYTVTLDQTVPSGNSVTVNFTYSGTALDGSDFTGVTSIVVAGGNTSATFNLATLEDGLPENSESIVIDIASIEDINSSFEAMVEGANNQVTTTIPAPSSDPVIAVDYESELISGLEVFADWSTNLNDEVNDYIGSLEIPLVGYGLGDLFGSAAGDALFGADGAIDTTFISEAVLAIRDAVSSYFADVTNPTSDGLVEFTNSFLESLGFAGISIEQAPENGAVAYRVALNLGGLERTEIPMELEGLDFDLSALELPGFDSFSLPFDVNSEDTIGLEATLEMGFIFGVDSAGKFYVEGANVSGELSVGDGLIDVISMDVAAESLVVENYSGEIVEGDVLYWGNAGGNLGYYTVTGTNPLSDGSVEITFLEDIEYDLIVEQGFLTKTFDLSANLGPVGINIDDGTFAVEAGFVLGATGRFSTSTMQEDSDGDLFGDATVDTSAAYHLLLPLAPDVGVEGLPLDQGIMYASYNNDVPSAGLVGALASLPNALQIEGLDKLLSLSAVSLDQLLAGLSSLLGNLVDPDSVYFEDIPAVGKSLADLLSIDESTLEAALVPLGVKAKDILGTANDDQTSLDLISALKFGVDELRGAISNIQDFEGILNNFVNTLMGLQLNPFTVTYENSTLSVDMDLKTIFSEELGFDLDLQQLTGLVPSNPLGDLSSFIGEDGLGLTASASGSLLAEASAGLDLGFSFDLSNITNPTLLIDGDSGLQTGLSIVNTSPLNLALGIDVNIAGSDVPLSVSVIDGTVDIELDAFYGIDSPHDQLALVLSDGLKFEDPDGNLILIDDVVGGRVDGQAEISLPLYFPVASLPFGGSSEDGNQDGVADNVLDLSFALAETGITDVELRAPELGGAFSLAAVLNDPATILKGLEGMFDGLKNVVSGRFSSLGLPLIGDALKGIDSFFDDMRDDLLGKKTNSAYQSGGLGFELEQAINNGDSVVELIQEALFNNLGEFLVAPKTDAGGVLQYQDNGMLKTKAVTSPEDIQLSFITDDSGTALQFNVLFAGELFNESLPIDFSMDALGFGIEVGDDSRVNLMSQYILGLGLGIDTSGFYLDTSGVTASGDELAFDINATLAKGTQVKGALGFLQATLTEVSNDGDGPSGVFGYVGVNLTDNDDDRFRPGETLAASVGLTASANIDFDAKLDFSPSGGAIALPEITSTIHYDQVFANVQLTSNGSTSSPPGDADIMFEDVTLDVGSFIKDFLGPIVTEVKNGIDPIMPLLDLFKQDIGLLVDLQAPATSLLGIAELAVTKTNDPKLGSILATYKSIENLIELIKLIDSFTSNTSAGQSGLNFGNFSLIDGVMVLDREGVDADETGSNPAAAQIIAAATTAVATGGVMPAVFELPLLSSPLAIADLITGNRAVDLFRYSLPALDFSLSGGEIQAALAEFGVPALPGFDVGLLPSSTIKLQTRFALGLDTSGIDDWRKAGATPLGLPLALLNGFFLDDHVVSGVDEPEAYLKTTLNFGAELDTPVLKAGAIGNITSEISLNLNDVGINDGKLYGDEVIEQLGRGPQCLFDSSGQISAGFEAYLWVGVDLGFFGTATLFDESYTLANIIIANFDHSCSDMAPPSIGSVNKQALDVGNPAPRESLDDIRPDGVYDQDGNLVAGVWDANGSTLTLNIGDLGKLRGDDFQGKNERVEVNQTRIEVVLDGVLQEKDVLQVTYEGFTRNFVNVKSIAADGGAGNDVILIGSSVTLDVLLEGGEGNDHLRYLGQGSAEIYGGKGNDILIGRSEALEGDGGADYLDGGDGNDVIDAGIGDDEIYGGAGNDRISGGEGNDYIEAGSGEDRVAGNDGDDEIYGDGGDDTLTGDSGNDRLFGGDGSDRIYGVEGDDIISGDDGDDLLVGGEGADVLRGADGDDRITWADGDGSDKTINGGAGSDSIRIEASAADDNIEISAVEIGKSNGVRVSVDGSALDSRSVERISLDAGDGADTLVIGDIEGSSVKAISYDLGTIANKQTTKDLVNQRINGESPAEAKADGKTDSVTIHGGQSDSVFRVVNEEPDLTRVTLNNDQLTITLLNRDLHKKNKTEGDLSILGGGGENTLIVDNSADTANRNGIKLTPEALIFPHLSGDLLFSNIGTVDVKLGSGKDRIDIDGSVGNTSLDTGAGNDVVNVSSLIGKAEILMGAGADEITLWQEDADVAPGALDLTIDGGTEGDTYTLNVPGASSDVSASSLININDSGVGGEDKLTYKGSSDNDTLQLTKDAKTGDGLIIAHYGGENSYNAAGDPSDFTDVEVTSFGAANHQIVVNYSTVDVINLFAGAGDDKIVSDYTAQSIDVRAGDGDDQIYIGSVLETESVLVQGVITTVVKEITDGANFTADYFGGDGDDYFEVNHNAAEIGLFGDNGSDVFFVKALLTLDENEEVTSLESKLANIKAAVVAGKSGLNADGTRPAKPDTREVDLDSLIYVQNANINIDGGAGVDAVTLVGTALSDTFYIFTETVDGKVVQRILGAGVKLDELVNIERVQLLTGSGDDIVYVYGVDLGDSADLLINTGSGSDQVIFGGPELTFDLQFPASNETQFTAAEGFRLGGGFRIDYGLSIRTITSTDRIVPFTIEKPAVNRTRTINASFSINNYRNPVLVTDSDGLADTITINNKQGATSLVFDTALLETKSISVVSSKIEFPQSDSRKTTDLIAQFYTLSNGDKGAIRNTISDVVTNQLLFADRYLDNELLNRMLTQEEVVLLPKGTSYAALQTGLNGQELVSVRTKLADYLKGTGFKAVYTENPHPDPDRAANGEVLYELDRIVNESNQRLQFEAQYSETVFIELDGTAVVYRDIAGVSLITARNIDLTLKAGFLKKIEDTGRSVEQWNVLHQNGQPSNIYFDGYDEVAVNLSEGGQTSTVLRNSEFDGILEVNGGSENDKIILTQAPGVVLLSGGAGDDEFEVRQADASRMLTDIYIEGGAGQDTVKVSTVTDTADEIEIEKKTLQEDIVQNRLDRVSNVLDFENVTAGENAAINTKLRREAVEVAELFTLATSQSVRDVADSAAQASADEIATKLRDALNYFKDELALSKLEREAVETTYVSKLLREYLFAEENKRAAKEVINLYERKADKMQELLEKHKESNVNGNIDVLLTYLETRDTELYDRLADAGTGLTKQDDNKLLNDLINVIINKSNKIAGLELSDWMQTALDRLDRYKKILSGAYKDRALWSRESAELKLPLREIFSSDRLKLLVGRTIDGEGIFAVSKDMTLTEIVDIKKEVRKKFNNVAAETESLIQAALSAARDLKNNDTGDVEALARALHSQLSVLDELLARSGKGVIGKYVGLIRADLQPLLVFAERNILSDAVNLYESMPSEKLFNLGQKFLNDPSKTWLKARNLFAQNNYQPVIESIELAARLAGQLEAVSVSAPSAKLISKQYKLFEVFRDNLEGGFDFERFKSVYEADEAKLVASADILGAIAEDARLNAQLASLMADRDAAEKIIQRNQAVTKLFENLKSDAAEDRKKIRTELEQRAESSFSFSFFGSFFGGIDTSPLESSRKYQVADSVFQDAKSALTKAEEKSEIVKDKLAKLNDKIQALEKQITKIGIEDQRTELVAVQQRLSSSFKFLNVLGTAMVDVISNSRADQSGEGFGNQSNLVSKIVGYSRSFDVTNTSLNPISSNELEKGANGQSVLVSQTTRQVQDVLSVSISQVGTSVNIHANYDDIESIQLTSSNKADVINIHDTLGSENSLIGVASRNGADVFTVTNQNEDNLSGAVNSLNDFVGNIFLNAGNGRDRLVVDDSGDKSGDDVSLLANGNENLRLTGLAKGDLTIRPGNFEGGYEILTGSGRDTVTISNLLENNTLQLSTGGGSDDVVFTEFSADTAKILINTGNGADVVDAELSPVGITVFAGVGRDTIRGSNFEDEIDGGNGNDLLIGNLGADILVGGQGSDWVIGDAGEARNAAGESVTLRDMGSIVFLGSSGLGGDDQINAGFGNNIVIGGIGNDQIVTEGSGNNVIIGDDGHIDFSNDDAIPMVIGVSSDDDVPFQVETNSRSLLKPGRVPTISLGYNDDIIGGSGNDLVIGGAGADAINTGDGDDIAIGDGAEARYVDEKISSIQSVNPEQGGNDTIIVGTGRTLIVGGAGSDSLSSGGGDAVDVIVGGTVEVNFDTAGAVANFNILAGANDGADVIKVESGAAVIVGNGDSDVIQAGQQVQVVADNPGTVQLDETGTVDLGDAGDSGEPGPVDLGGADDPSTPGTVDPLDDPGPRDIFMFHSQSLREIMQSVYLMASSDQSVEDEEQDDESSRAAMPWNVLAGSSSQDNSERKGLITLQGFTELEARAQSRKFEKWN